MKFFEDFVVGTKDRFGHYAVSREEVLEFASRYDPQPFHLDDKAAKNNPIFGRLAASGWHTAAIAMRLLVDHDAACDGGRLGSPGLEELSWLKPVYPGDTLSMETEVMETKTPRARTDIGFVKVRTTVFNQKDEAVMRQVGTFIHPRRAAAQSDIPVKDASRP
ncbi:MAG: MaoC family dehydratase [Rhodospirillaceae bacterium]|nr:MaoC family dehydratase [Rhodospirillaceae bacterium]